MGAKGTRTGRTQPAEAFKVAQVNDVYDLLKNTANTAGNDLLTSDPSETNLAVARNQITDQSRQFDQGLTRSLVGRGVANSGLATTAMAAGHAGISGELINNALQRSFAEKLQARQTGASLQQLLAGFVQNLVGAGISGQASDYGARSSNNPASRHLGSGLGG